VSDLNWDTDFNAHFVKGKLIGQGSFGSVYLGIDLHTGQQVGSQRSEQVLEVQPWAGSLAFMKKYMALPSHHDSL
jgi:serine/threonine protein kinase